MRRRSRPIALDYFDDLAFDFFVAFFAVVAPVVAVPAVPSVFAGTSVVAASVMWTVPPSGASVATVGTAWIRAGSPMVWIASAVVTWFASARACSAERPVAVTRTTRVTFGDWFNHDAASRRIVGVARDAPEEPYGEVADPLGSNSSPEKARVGPSGPSSR
jgi:hypothetical protein